LSEENPLPVIKRLIDLKLLQAIHPEWTLTSKESLLFGEIRTVLAWFDLLYLNEPYEKWLIYFLALTQPITRFSELRLRLGLPKRVFEIMTLSRNEEEKGLMTFQKNPEISRNEIYKVLSSFPNEVLLFLMAKAGQETGRKAISLYFTQLKSIRIAIRGNDLKTLGLVPGPIYKVILGDLLEARINGKVLTREDEIAYVKKHFVPQDKT
jgi:tRNA nucleotidyltransferase (CCA-adding enzyme)